MKVIKSVVETKVALSDSGNKRYEYTKEFQNEKGKKILLIMLNPSGTNNINAMDTTTNLTMNNLTALGYSTITIWNLFPDIVAKLNSKQIIQDLDNLNYLKELLKRNYDSILIGWGNSFSTNKVANCAKEQVHVLLKTHEGKLVQIEDEEGKYTGKSIHPLFAGLYFNHKWRLRKYIIPEPKIQMEKAETKTKEGKTEERANGTNLADKPSGKNKQRETTVSGTDGKNTTGCPDNQ